VKNIVVTGAAGFIGSNLTRKLLENKNYRVFGIDLKNKNKNLILRKIKSRKFLYYKKNFLNIKNFNFLPGKIDIIFHCASIVGVSKYMSETINLIENNFYGSKKAINFALKTNSKIIFFSTSEIYGKNKDIPWKENSDRVLGDPSVLRWSYSSSKSLMEHYFFAHGKEKKLKFSIIRPFNVYGPGQNPIFVVSSTLKKIMNNNKPEIYDGGLQSRCFTFVDDIVKAAIKIAFSNKTNNRAYNVGRNKSYTIKQTLQICKDILRSDCKLKKVSTKKRYGKLYEDIHKRIPDVSNLKKDINWVPSTDLKTGLIKTINWIKKNPEYLN